MGLYPYADRFAVTRSFPPRGRPRSEVLAEIEAMAQAEDSPYHEGKISGSIYSGDEQHYAFLNEVFGPNQEQFDHAWAVLDAYEEATTTGDRKGAVMMGDEMIDEASRKVAIKVVSRGERAGFTRTSD